MAAAGEIALQTFHDWCASEGVAFDREVRVGGVCAWSSRNFEFYLPHSFEGAFLYSQVLAI
jgi:hypothetical protein